MWRKDIAEEKEARRDGAAAAAAVRSRERKRARLHRSGGGGVANSQTLFTINAAVELRVEVGTPDLRKRRERL